MCSNSYFSNLSSFPFRSLSPRAHYFVFIMDVHIVRGCLGIGTKIALVNAVTISRHIFNFASITQLTTPVQEYSSEFCHHGLTSPPTKIQTLFPGQIVFLRVFQLN